MMTTNAVNAPVRILQHMKKHGDEKYCIPDECDKKAREARTRRQAAPIEAHGNKLCRNDSRRSGGHQDFDGMQSFFPSPSYLTGPYAVPFLNEHFRKVNGVKNQQNRNG